MGFFIRQANTASSPADPHIIEQRGEARIPLSVSPAVAYAARKLMARPLTCACRGLLGPGGPNDDAHHSPIRCWERTGLPSGGTLENKVTPCRCLLPTCRVCNSRPDIDQERSLSMLIIDADKAARREAEPRLHRIAHYYPDHLVGGILRLR